MHCILQEQYTGSSLDNRMGCVTTFPEQWVMGIFQWVAITATTGKTCMLQHSKHLSFKKSISFIIITKSAVSSDHESIKCCVCMLPLHLTLNLVHFYTPQIKQHSSPLHMYGCTCTVQFSKLAQNKYTPECQYASD